MNAKEKAKEMMHYYLKELLSAKYSINGFVINDLAKQCALIAVDEMIIQNGELYLLGLAKDYYTEKNAYLFNVKSELRSL